MEWDDFIKERTTDAIELLLETDSLLVADYIADQSFGSGIDAEDAHHVMSLALVALLAQDDRTIDKEKKRDLKSFFEKTLLESKFFEGLVEYKLNEMWDMGW